MIFHLFMLISIHYIVLRHIVSQYDNSRKKASVTSEVQRQTETAHFVLILPVEASRLDLVAAIDDSHHIQVAQALT